MVERPVTPSGFLKIAVREPAKVGAAWPLSLHSYFSKPLFSLVK
jgi:hypothetical protein